jgi:hypothetical protein
MFKLVLLSSVIVSLTGCAAIPMVASGVSGLNGANKKGDQSTTLTCKTFPDDSFRSVSASNGGITKVDEFGRSMSTVYDSNNVKVSLLTVKPSQPAKDAVIEKVSNPQKNKHGKKLPTETEKVVTPATPAVDGVYQIFGTSSNGVSRAWEFDDGIGNTTQKTVDALVNSGCVVTETKRGESLMDSISSKTTSN